MDSTLRGWAKLDIAAGESAIQSNVTWDIENYTDHFTNIPTTNVLIKDACARKHIRRPLNLKKFF
jgi:hypothetical protein